MPKPILDPNQYIMNNSIQVIKILGSGKYGYVWKARMVTGNHDCAVKEVEVRDSETRERILRECEIGTDLNRLPGILGARIAFEHEQDRILIVMDLMEQDLNDRLRTTSVSFDQAF